METHVELFRGFWDVLGKMLDPIIYFNANEND